MITTLFNKVNIILKLQIYVDLVTCSHSDCSLARSWEPAGISRELGFFQVSSYLSCREIQIGKKRKEKKEKIKRRRRRKKKEKKEGKRGREENEKRFSFIYFCQVSCKVNESPRPKGRKLEKWQPFCLLVFQSSMSRSRVDFNSTFKHSTISTVKSSVDSQCSAFFSVEMPGIKLTLLNITVSWRRFYVTRA